MQKLNKTAIIPARMGSTRFPGKPMAEILGMPMIEHVYRRVKLNQNLDDVYVATCDNEIFDHITSIGGKALMTSDCHERCTDRCAEAMLKIEETKGTRIDIMVLVQGDEPLTHPAMIDEALMPFNKSPDTLVSCLVGAIQTAEEFENPNEVKVVMDLDGNALYFSREPIPSRKKYSGEIPMYKQIPIIPFGRDFLIKYNKMHPTPLEIIESVDMMRVLEHGYKLPMVVTHHVVKAVDTPGDLEVVVQKMKSDVLVSQYLE